MRCPFIYEQLSTAPALHAVMGGEESCTCGHVCVCVCLCACVHARGIGHKTVDVYGDTR